jgi:2,4-dienoyl-CoA reductase-like NADH-dependent reductase (Old Yellow Enzyme family)
MATDDTCIDGYRALAAAVKPHGTALFGQLFHPGREVMDLADGALTVAVAPSAVPTERFRVMPRPLRLTEIREIIDGFGQAAARLQRAGLDGVEVVASHGYLPSQFLNPAVNLRTDDYGGTTESRLRFLREAFESIRRHCGPGFVAGLRISLDERDPAGLPAGIALAASVSLAADGLADYLSVTTGTSASLAGSGHIAPDMSSASGYVAPLSGKLRAAVSVPVLVAGRINQPQEAEHIIAAGQADACVMTRAMICDPDMPGLARAGQTDDIRACIGCNQACIGHFHLGFPISCIQHPETGRERVYGIRRRADRPKKVMVAGGGPAADRTSTGFWWYKTVENRTEFVANAVKVPWGRGGGRAAVTGVPGEFRPLPPGRLGWIAAAGRPIDGRRYQFVSVLAKIIVSAGVLRVAGPGAVSWDRAPDRREIPARRGCRPRRHGSGVAGARRAPQPRSGGERAGLVGGPVQGRALGGLPPRDQGGAGRRPAQSPQRDPGLRHHGSRWLPVDRHGTPTVMVAAEPDRAAGTARPRAYGRGRPERSRRAARRARSGHRAPGRQAGERGAGQGPGRAYRLRNRAG